MLGAFEIIRANVYFSTGQILPPNPKPQILNPEALNLTAAEDVGESLLVFEDGAGVDGRNLQKDRTFKV